MFRHVDFVQAPKFCGPQYLGLYEIHMPKHRNPQHIGLHEIHEVHKLAAVVVRGKRRRHHFQVANASDRLHCDNVLKLLSRRLFLIACAQSCRESRLARNVTALQLHRLHAAF